MLAFFDGGGEGGDKPCSPAGGGHEGFPARYVVSRGRKHQAPHLVREEGDLSPTTLPQNSSAHSQMAKWILGPLKEETFGSKKLLLSGIPKARSPTLFQSYP